MAFSVPLSLQNTLLLHLLDANEYSSWLLDLKSINLPGKIGSFKYNLGTV